MGIFLISKRFECKMMPYLHKYLRIFHYYLVTLSDFYCSLFCLQFWLVCIFPIMKNFLINHFSSFPTCWDVSFALLLDVKLFKILMDISHDPMLIPADVLGQRIICMKHCRLISVKMGLLRMHHPPSDHSLWFEWSGDPRGCSSSSPEALTESCTYLTVEAALSAQRSSER